MRVALVVDRCGEASMGGVESLALGLASQLASAFDVEVLTTCARDAATWRNEFSEGIDDASGVRIRRFRVDAPRDPAHFDRASRVLRRLRAVAPLGAQEAWMRRQGPYSTALFSFIGAHASDYDAFAFAGYLYATTYFGMRAVARKSLLIPAAHDEWTIRLPLYRRVFETPRALAFLSAPERALVLEQFPRCRGEVIGAGVSAPGGRDPERFRRAFGIEGPFALYLGRVDAAKDVRALYDDFVRLSVPRPVRTLVFAGERTTALPSHPDVRCIGSLDERAKWDALEACSMLVMPSRYESLSLALLEAWSCEKPVLVSSRSPVLVDQCRRSSGGIAYGSFAAFERGIAALVEPGGRELGAAGGRFVREHYAWPNVTAAYRALLDEIAAGAV